MRKKFMKCVAAAAITALGAMAAAFPVLADSPIKSSGNLIYEDETVSLYAADFDYLYAEVDDLQQEQGVTALSAVSEKGAERREGLSSRGVINYADGTVVMDSSDFVRLADRIDGLDAAFENGTLNAAEALRQIGTYFTTDGSVTHDLEKAAGSDGSTLKLPYHKISEGILQSQSVSHLAEQKIEAAAAENLSVGTAAWVDGKLLVGNGADNDACYQEGYSAGEAAGYQIGYAMGVKDAESNVNPSSASYQEGYNVGYNAGYAQGKEASAPVILTGTFSDFEATTTHLSGSVSIPAGLTYVCAGFSVSECEIYSYPPAEMWRINANWNYDKDTGLVSFYLRLGGEKYRASNPVMEYTIMYIP